ncbi:hypothetical protein AALP_AA6G030600 [Arabis alpina]|uniref:Importin subunit alpha n=1 Tax=Arabis alpina TaxID=50452 RepID=A0A087GLS1_ARAAL|nr:hypothetical protein AALP_AA6G030600 [Arabis alpina]
MENLQKKRLEELKTMPLDLSSSNLSIGNLPLMRAWICSDDSDSQLKATNFLRRLLSIENPPINAVVQSSVVPRLVMFLSRDSFPELQFEAAWVLTNIASGTSENTKTIVESGAIPIFIQLLSSPSEDVREQAVWALGNIAGDSPKCRDLVLSYNAMMPLLSQFNEHTNLSMMRNATWTLSNLCRGKPQPSFEQRLVQSTDEEILADACWALSYVSDNLNEKIQAVIDLGVIPRLIELLSHSSQSVPYPALRTIGNIVMGDDDQTQTVLDHQVLPRLLNLLINTYKKSIKKETCLIISNITARNSNQLQAVIEAGIIQSLVWMLQTAEFEVKKEAAWAISNATSSGTHDQIKFLVSQGCIKPLCDLLTCQDRRIITICLQALENILVVGEAEKNLGHTGGDNLYAIMVYEEKGLEKIEILQHHDNNEICQKAAKILETFWAEDDDKEGNDENFGFVLRRSNLARIGAVALGPYSRVEKEMEEKRLEDLETMPPNGGDLSLTILAKNLLKGSWIWSDDSDSQLKATNFLRRLLSIEKNPPIDVVVQSGIVVPRMVKFLSRDDFPELQFEATWVLTNIASGTSEHTKVIAESGAIPIFIQLLSSASENVREQAVWALGNIAGDSQKCRDFVLNYNAMMPLLSQINEHTKPSMLRNATWTLSNLCSGKPKPSFEKTKPALPVLERLVQSTDEEVLTDACRALSYLSHNISNDEIQAVIDAGVIPRLIQLLSHSSSSVLIPALRTIRNIVSGDDDQTQTVLEHQVLPRLLNLLTNTYKKRIKKEACLIISNITARNSNQIQAVIDAGIIPSLVSILQTAEFEVKKQAAWGISNATSSGTHDQIKFMVSQGCIKPICDLLTCPDQRIITVCLQALENILVVGESEKNLGHTGDNNLCASMIDEAQGLEKIEILQRHDNNEINQKAAKILETFWAEDYDKEGNDGNFGFVLV